MESLIARPKNYGFAFNDTDFSDRILHIEIIPDNSLPPNSNDSDSSVGVQTKSLHISSAILAAESPFFYKLFKTKMIESQKRDVTLKIHPSEEAALMDILNFIYNNALSATTCSDLLDVLVAADKYEVTSCMKYCMQLLLNMPMSLESALQYLELPLTALVVQPLIDTSKEYLFARYRNLNKCKAEEARKLPLSAIKVILGSKGLQVRSEDDVFEFILDWVDLHYPNVNESREIIANHLAQYIGFGYMSYSKLKDILFSSNPYFDHEQLTKHVMEALFFKAEGKHMKSNHLGRFYSFRPVKVVELESHRPRCLIYFDLKKDECQNLFPSEELFSESFLLGKYWCRLMAQCDMEQGSLSHHFGVYFRIQEGPRECMMDYELAVMKKPKNEFEIQLQIKDGTVNEGEDVGLLDLFDLPWTEFMSEDSQYFIDGILHLRADATIIDTQEA